MSAITQAGESGFVFAYVPGYIVLMIAWFHYGGFMDKNIGIGR